MKNFERNLFENKLGIFKVFSLGFLSMYYKKNKFFNKNYTNFAGRGGQSLSLFYESGDEKFMLKSVPTKEIQTVSDVFDKYAEYILSNGQSLLNKVHLIFRIECFAKVRKADDSKVKNSKKPLTK